MKKIATLLFMAAITCSLSAQIDLRSLKLIDVNPLVVPRGLVKP